MSDQDIKVCDNADAARWAIAEHRADVLDMARAVASGWDWSQSSPLTDPEDCVAIGRISAAIVAAVDDALDGDA